MADPAQGQKPVPGPRIQPPSPVGLPSIPQCPPRDAQWGTKGLFPRMLSAFVSEQIL